MITVTLEQMLGFLMTPMAAAFPPSHGLDLTVI